MNYKPPKIRLELDGRKCRATWPPGCQTPGRSGRGHTISDGGAASAGRNRMPTTPLQNASVQAPGTRETREINELRATNHTTVSAGPRGSAYGRGESCVAAPARPGVHSPGTQRLKIAGGKP